MFNLSSLIIGPTDRSKIFRFGKIKELEYTQYKEEIAKVLVKKLGRVDIIPDDGIPLEIARSYKQFGGKMVVGNIPKEGGEILQPYFKYCDKIEKIDGGWAVLNTCLSLKSGIMIGFGLSPGTLVEIAYSKYHKEYLGKDIPILLDRRTISQNLPQELLEEINLSYFDSAEQLNEFLKDITLKK